MPYAFWIAALAASYTADGPLLGPWPPRGYACPFVAVPIEIDGRLDEPGWADAPWTALFVDIEGSRKPKPRYQTRAKMAWDSTYFYVGAEMEEPHLWATLKERDSVIYYDNDFEVFIDPDGDSHLYTEIELNAFNTVWDLLLIRPYRDGGPAIHAWDIPGLKTAVHLQGTVNDPSDTDSGWSVEIAIPFSVLAETTTSSCPPSPGDRWRVNFSRVQWRLDSVDDGYRKSVDPDTDKPFPEDNWVWSAQRQIAMHEPEYWGIVQFMDGASAETVQASRFDAAGWHLRQLSYRLSNHKDEYGEYPQSFAAPNASPGAPPLGESWTWPPLYWSDGVRYTLALRGQDRTLTLHEDGRLAQIPRD